MATSEDWSKGYARQAQADMRARDALASTSGAICQELHFLQMACEKLAKAHLCCHGSNPADLQGSHAYVHEVIPVILRERLGRLGGKQPKSRWKIVKWRLLAREIDLLAPAVDDNGRRPDNTEYPWADSSGRIVVPAEHDFPNLAMLSDPIGREFLKLVKASIEDLVK